MDSVNPTTSDLLVKGNEFDAVNPSLSDSRNNGVDFDSLLGEESQGGDATNWEAPHSMNGPFDELFEEFWRVFLWGVPN